MRQIGRKIRPRPGRGTAVRGSVTAELAVVLPALTVLLALLFLGAGAAILQLRLEDGARAGVRALARGEESALAVELATRAAGEQVSVSLGVSGGFATVTVTGTLSGPLAGLVPWRQSARADARVEVAPAEAACRPSGPGPGRPGSHPVARAGPYPPCTAPLRADARPWRWVFVEETRAALSRGVGAATRPSPVPGDVAHAGA
ncbi:TadE family type IV pilus minor pilin [Specibacter sp. RAF43]|uniref:TadE family type IV pilus minor pilin n=1 Tax=Specibacter sp. RAF43 TaxID=3233057 RepID=UPI003F9558D4